MITPRDLAFFVVLGALATAIAGCQDSDLGECNLTGETEAGNPIPGPVALDIAYKATDGIPMYEGQALVQSSCGNGQFCHTPNAQGENRIGTPKTLDFDVALACTDPTVDSTCADLQPCADSNDDSPYCQRLRRLRDGSGKSAAWGELMISEIRDGTMPPGDAGSQVVDRTPWFRADGTPLPEWGTAEATDIVRNWLACKAPVVARTELAPTVEDELAECPSVDGEVCRYSGPSAPLPEATWSSIYDAVILPQCVVCHSPGGVAPFLDLTGEASDMSDWASSAHMALVNVPVSPDPGAACFVTQAINVIPGNPDDSLMIQKMRNEQTCGAEMPIAGGVQTIPNPVIAVIEQWILDGAPNN